MIWEGFKLKLGWFFGEMAICFSLIVLLIVMLYGYAFVHGCWLKFKGDKKRK